MPQGRSLAFSGKKKKEQLKNKRNQKKTRPTEKSQNADELFDGSRGVSGRGDASPSVVNVSKSEKYKLLFQYETKESIEAAKRRAQEEVIQPSDLEKQIALDDVYDSLIDFPKRPHWAGETDPRKIDAIERKVNSLNYETCRRDKETIFTKDQIGLKNVLKILPCFH